VRIFKFFTLGIKYPSRSLYTDMAARAIVATVAFFKTKPITFATDLRATNVAQTSWPIARST